MSPTQTSTSVTNRHPASYNDNKPLILCPITRCPCEGESWGLGAYGGTWIENSVQAVARDVFAAAMLRLDKAGYPIVLHVHDEIVAEVPDDFGSTRDFEKIITELPDWASGLPIAAKTREGPRFCKV